MQFSTDLRILLFGELHVTLFLVRETIDHRDFMEIYCEVVRISSGSESKSRSIFSISTVYMFQLSLIYMGHYVGFKLGQYQALIC